MANAFLVRLLVLAGLFAGAGRADGAPWRDTQIHSLAFSPDGKQLAVVRIDDEWMHAPDAGFISRTHLGNLARTISLVDVPSASLKRVIQHDFVPGDQDTGEQYWEQGRDAVAFDSAGQSLLVRDFAGADVRRIDLASGKTTPFFTPPAGSSIAGMCLSPDRTRLAVADRGWVALLDAQTGETLVETKANSGDDQTYPIGVTLPVSYGEKLLAVSSNNRWVAVASGPNVWLCDANNKLARGVSIACQEPFAFVPGGQQFAYAVNDRIFYFDLDGQRLDRQDARGNASEPNLDYPNNVHRLAFLPDGDRLIVAIGDRLRLERRADGTGRTLRADRWATDLAISPDGQLAAIGGDGNVTLVNLADRIDRTIAIPSGAQPDWAWRVSLAIPPATCGCLAWRRVRKGAFFPPAPPGSGWVLAVGLLIPLAFCLLGSLATLQKLGMMIGG